jgi:hypothetical protein
MYRPGLYYSLVMFFGLLSEANLKKKILTIITMQRKEFGTFYFIIDVLKSGSEPRTYSESGSGTVHQIRIKISQKPEPNPNTNPATYARKHGAADSDQY